MKLISAQQARMNNSNKLFIKTMEQVNEAILKASVSKYDLLVDAPKGICITIFNKRKKGDSVAYEVADALIHEGYEVVLMHDAENGSIELSISW